MTENEHATEHIQFSPGDTPDHPMYLRLSVGDIVQIWGAPVQIVDIQESSGGRVATIMYLCNPERPDEGDYYAGLQRIIPLNKLGPIGALSEGVKARMDHARKRALQLVQGINKAQASAKGQSG